MLAAGGIGLAQADEAISTSAMGAAAMGGVSADFDSAFLVGGASAVDLARYRYGNPINAGDYRVDITLNGVHVMRHTVTFADTAGSGSATPCLSGSLLTELGVVLDETLSATECVDIAAVDPAARVLFDVSRQVLALSIPQAALLRRPRGHVDPSHWDNGINALTVGYGINAFKTRDGSSSTYLGLNSGLNLGAWRFRHNANASHTDGETRWNSLSTYAQRSLPAYKSQLTLGDSFTSGDLFDSIGFRGIRMATDDRMLPQSLRGYAPVVRGSADTQARVQIRQNGELIYETSVSPGPFVIEDLYAGGYGGDLDVTVTEEDGSVKRFSVPYAAVPQLLRPGYSRFSATVGQLRGTRLDDEVHFAEATWQRGISNPLTGYGGVQLSDEDYQSVMGGLAFNTPIGAVAIDSTFARAANKSIDGRRIRSEGTSSRVTYSNLITSTGTSFSLAAYRYSTQGYRSLSDSAYRTDTATDPVTGPGWEDDDWALPLLHSKNRLQLNINQDFGERGAFHLSGSVQNYWNNDSTDRQFVAGYSNRAGRASYSIGASRERLGDGRWDNRYTFSMSVPLGDAGTRRRPVLVANYSKDEGGATRVRTGLSGSLGENNQGNYAISAARGSRGTSDYNISAGYNSGVGSVSGGYSQSQGGNRTLSGRLSGALVAFPGHILLAPQLGDTIAIVEAKGAQGARLNTGNSIQVGADGYAVSPYLTPYQYNHVGLDPKGASLDFELKNTSMRVAPTAGAVVKLEYEVERGRAAVITIVGANGERIPFGADVYDGTQASARVVGVVGQGSRALVRVSADSGTLQARWQDGECSFDYALPPAAKGGLTPIVEARCRLPGEVGAP